MNRSHTEKSNINATHQIEVDETAVVVKHGYNVRHFRTARGFSQEYMAAKLNITQPRFSDLEKDDIIDDKILQNIV